MNMMNNILGDYLDKFFLVFLDNILIYSANLEVYLEHLQKTLLVLHKYWFYAKASKCEFVITTIEFLGQRVCVGGISPTEAKLIAICN